MSDHERRFIWDARASVGLKARETSKGIAAGSDPAHQLICGYAAVFFKASDKGTEFELYPGLIERIDPHAFDRAIREDDVRGLFNHDPSQILGRSKSGTMKLSVDEVGLYYEIDPPATQIAKTVTIALERKDVSGSSFMFDITAEEYLREGDRVIRTIKEAVLYDVGPVTFPAYTAATSEVSARALSEFQKLGGKITGKHLDLRPGRSLDLARRQLELLKLQS